ncbi:phage major tail tube protein [Geovibrio ferrireducens]|uniref:phage major tail tube protein n=1 Tax=Geovibrio ferrireducens TaxID=46201 RepID=UPI002248720A|nr:phage major tail tube protein [Geovibrio ferrireducens]
MKVIGAKVWKDGKEHAVADVTLPSLEAMSDTIKGGGIAGEMDVPVIGQFGEIEMECTWRSTTKEAYDLMKPGPHELEVRGALQELDKNSGKWKVIAVRVFVRATPKKLEGGKLETAASMDIPQAFSLSYMKTELDGEEMVELDKLNYIYKVRGEDVLADVRKAMGME